MAANSFGERFTLTTYGESHGVGIGAIVDGCPPGLALSSADIQPALDRRRPGRHAAVSPRNEADKIQILSGVFEGKTTGAPIGLYIPNQDARSQDYNTLKAVYRPGHADYTYAKKYGIRDHRGGGRASARETALRVAAGAIAQKWLKDYHGINVQAFIEQIGPIAINPVNFNAKTINENPFFSPDATSVPEFSALIEALKQEGDSIGAKVGIIATGVPLGLGEPIYGKLSADLAGALMSINAVKGVEIGDGFEAVTQKGSQHRDEMDTGGFLSNHAGGILGGISTGAPIVAHMAVKPPASITKAGKTLNTEGKMVPISVNGRHDPCVGIRAVPVAEAMVAMVIMDHVLKRLGNQ